MNILVLGVSGFVGSWVAKVLLDQGFAVTGLVGSRSSSSWRVTWLDKRYDGFRLLTTDTFSVDGLIVSIPYGAHFDALVNCIGGGMGPHQEVADLWEANVHVSYAAAQAAGDVGIPRLVVAGSALEYGFSDVYRTFDEDSPARPTSMYSVTKAAGFLAVKEACRLNGICLDYLRIFGALGPGDNPCRLLPYAIRTLLRGQECDLTDGYQVRDFVAVEDVARAFLAVLQWRSAHEVEVFNVASARGTTVRELVGSVCRHLGVSDSLLQWGARPNRKEEGRFLIGANEKIRSIVGWTPCVDLDSIVTKTVEYCRRASHPVG